MSHPLLELGGINIPTKMLFVVMTKCMVLHCHGWLDLMASPISCFLHGEHWKMKVEFGGIQTV